MKIKSLLIYAILLSFISGYSQEEDSYEIKLLFSGMIKNYKIDYHRSENSTIMVVSKDTSTSTISEKDYLKMKKLIIENKKDATRKVIQIAESHKKYKTDTLNLKPENSIEKTVDNFVENWERIKSELELNPDKRLVLDGHSVVIFLKTNQLNYEQISARTPTVTSHPEIFELISKMEAYYKNKSKNPLID
jgi:hypothetical protein